MKPEGTRAFRDRKVDDHKRLDIVRNLKDVDDIRVRTRLKSQIVQEKGSILHNLRSLSAGCIETPSCKVVTKWYEGGEFFEHNKRKFAVPDQYIRASQERQRYPETGLEYDLDEEDEVWLSERGRECKILEEDLENMLIRLEFASHATTDSKVSSVSESLPQESAIAILAANGFSHLTYQDLTLVYKYWVGKRDAFRKPLLRCLQPPPALDESNPYDLFCGSSKGNGMGRHNSKNNKAKFNKAGGHTFWQPKPNAELTTPKALQHFREDVPKPVLVASGDLAGRLLSGLRLGEEYVSYHGRLLRPQDFVLKGEGVCYRNWKAALRVKATNQSVGEWLRIRGKALGSGVLGKIVSVYNKNLNLFRSGIIEDFDRANGQHLVRYLDGFEEEWLHLPMEWVRWLPGSSVDFGIRVVKKVRKRTPLRSPGRCPGSNIASIGSMAKGGHGLRTLGGFFNSKKALQYQLATVQDWFLSLCQSALNFAASLQPGSGSASPLRRGEFNGLAKLAARSKKGKELLKWAPGYSRAKAKGLLDAESMHGQNPEILPVVLGDLEGFLVSGCSQREDMVVFEGKEITPCEFVAKSGAAPTNACVPTWAAWMNLIQVKLRGDAPGPCVGDWLRARGHEVGVTVVTKGLGVYRPEIGVFHWGNVVAFDRLSGKHLVQYEDGTREWLFLSIHFIKWAQDPRKRKEAPENGAASSSAPNPVAKKLKFS